MASTIEAAEKEAEKAGQVKPPADGKAAGKGKTGGGGGGGSGGDKAKPMEGGSWHPLTYVALATGGYAAFISLLAYSQGVARAEKYDPLGIIKMLNQQGQFEHKPLGPLDIVSPQATVTHQVYMDVFISQTKAGRLVLGLYGGSDGAPKAVENFLALVDGTKVKDPKDKSKTVGYKGTTFHRIIPGFMAQGGDVTKDDGTGGTTLSGKPLPDESSAMKLKHVGAGVVSMANKGPNTATSQFFITTNETPWLDGKHAVIGIVLKGQDTMQQIEDIGSQSGTPSVPAYIHDCGVLPN